ncbi:MAG: hypothetical protein ACXVBW_01590 [Bdellovibrionota bacterium]
MLDSLIDALKPGELKLSDTLIFTQATLKNTLRPLFQKILGNKNTLGLDHAVLHELWLQFDYWHVSQRYLEGAFLQLQGDLPEGSIRGSMVPEEILSVPLNTIFTDPKLLSQAQDKISFVQSILQNPLERAVFEGDDGEMSFAFNRSDLRHSYHDWAQKIWMHRVARVLLNSYSRPGESSVDVSAFKQFYADFKEIGVELRFFMQNDDGRDIPSRFREANLFTFSGNGDSRLDESELSQLFTFILSSKNMGDRVHKIAAQKCSSGKLDSAGEPMLFADCFRLRYFSQFERIYAQMPELAKAYRELYQDSSKYNERMAFEQNLIQGAFGTQLITQVDSAGSQTMAMISHYVEALFARFDVNDDGVLDHAEGEEAFRVFEPMITRLIREKLGQGSRSDAACPPYPDPQWVPRAVFMYMLAKGHLPEDGAKGMMDLNNFNNLEWNWGKMIHADRARVLSIFAAINPKKDPSASPRIFPEGCFDLVR